MKKFYGNLKKTNINVTIKLKMLARYQPSSVIILWSITKIVLLNNIVKKLEN